MGKTLKTFNKIAKEHDLELVQGRGYLYWDGISEEMKLLTSSLFSTSVGVCKFSHLPFDRWVNDELPDILKKIEKERS